MQYALIGHAPTRQLVHDISEGVTNGGDRVSCVVEFKASLLKHIEYLVVVVAPLCECKRTVKTNFNIT